MSDSGFVVIILAATAFLLNVFMLVLAIIQEIKTVKQRKKTVSLILLVFLFQTNVLSSAAIGFWYWGGFLQQHSSAWCIATSYSTWILDGLNRILLMIIAIDRFLAVMNPFRYKQVMGHGKIITLVFCYCGSIVLMPSIIVDNYNKGYVYYMELNFCLPVSTATNLLHAWYLNAIVFPVLVLTVLYSYMIHFLAKKIRSTIKRAAMSNALTSPVLSTDSSAVQPDICKRRSTLGIRKSAPAKLSTSEEPCQVPGPSQPKPGALMMRPFKGMIRSRKVGSLNLINENQNDVPFTDSSPSPPEQRFQFQSTVRHVLTVPIVHVSQSSHRGREDRLSPPTLSLPNVSPKLMLRRQGIVTPPQGNPLAGAPEGSGLTKLFHYSKRKLSDTDSAIRRCSSIVSTTLRPRYSVRQLNMNGLIFHKFKSIYTVIGFCLGEMLVVSLADVAIYGVVVLAEWRCPIMSVHIQIIHLLLTPVLYSYGFAPLKKRIKKALKMRTEAVINSNDQDVL